MFNATRGPLNPDAHPQDALQTLDRDERVFYVGTFSKSLFPMAHLPSGRHLSFFASAFVFGTPEYPLCDIPFQQIIDDVTAARYRALPAHVFQFNEIQAAHRLMDAHAARGKIVVVNH